MISTLLSMGILTLSAVMSVRGLYRLMNREDMRRWLPSLIRGFAWGIAGVAVGIDSPIWLAIGSFAIVGGFAVQWRLDHA